MASPGQPSARWRRFVDERPITSILLVGVIATQLGTYFGYVFPAIGLPTLPWPLYNGLLAIGVAEGANGVFANFEAFAGNLTGSFFAGQMLPLINPASLLRHPLDITGTRIPQAWSRPI